MEMDEIYAQTLTLRELLNTYSAGNHEVLLQKVVPLLRTRGQLIYSLSGECTDEQRIIGEKILGESKKMMSELLSARSDLLKNMNQFRQRKQSLRRYRHPYAGPTKDGMFLDKRE